MLHEKKKKVAIIEIGGSHIETIHTITYLLQQQNFDISIICNKGLWPLFPNPSVFSKHLLLPNQLALVQQIVSFIKIRRFIKKNKINAAILGTTEITLVRNLILFLPKNCVYTGIIHNAKKLEKGSTIKNIVFRRVKQFLVLSNYLLKSISPLPQYKVGVLLPIYFPKPTKLAPINIQPQDCVITIPGTVEIKRRDYLPFLNELSKLPYHPNLKIVFLGKFDMTIETLIAEKLQQMPEWKNGIIFFNNYLSYEIFHSYIKETDYILPLIKPEGDSFYGDYRVSGSVNLGLGYHIPFLMPSMYNENEDAHPFSIYYSSYQELFELIINHPKELLQKSTHITDAYTHAYFNNTEALSKNFSQFVLNE